MTDKSKLLAFCDECEIPHLTSGGYLFLGGRRYSFNKEGEISAILDLTSFEKAGDENEYGETMKDFYSMEVDCDGQ